MLETESKAISSSGASFHGWALAGCAVILLLAGRQGLAASGTGARRPSEEATASSEDESGSTDQSGPSGDSAGEAPSAISPGAGSAQAGGGVTAGAAPSSIGGGPGGAAQGAGSGVSLASFGSSGGNTGGAAAQSAYRAISGAARAAAQALATVPSAPGYNARLSGVILQRASAVASQINASGGYRFDGVNDCYGFDRRVWNPVLEQSGRPDLPVSDYPDRNWAYISSWASLVPGDVLATNMGHFWGPDWHGGLYAGYSPGKYTIFDNSDPLGARVRTLSYPIFHYYYIPTHRMLTNQ